MNKPTARDILAQFVVTEGDFKGLDDEGMRKRTEEMVRNQVMRLWRGRKRRPTAEQIEREIAEEVSRLKRKERGG